MKQINIDEKTKDLEKETMNDPYSVLGVSASASDDEIKKARALLEKMALPKSAAIVGIELGEFFPPDKKFSVNF